MQHWDRLTLHLNLEEELQGIDDKHSLLVVKKEAAVLLVPALRCLAVAVVPLTA